MRTTAGPECLAGCILQQPEARVTALSHVTKPPSRRQRGRKCHGPPKAGACRASPVDAAAAAPFTAPIQEKGATMIAGLLYLIGLISVLVTIAATGVNIPPTVTEVTRVIDAGNADYLALVRNLSASYAWAVVPFIGGLLLMAAGRVIMLLSAINRSLRGQN